MPDFEHAVTVIFAVGAFVEVMKILVGARLAQNPRALVGVVLVASFAAVYTVRYSLWSHDQVIHNKPLDEVSTANLITLAVLLFLIEVGIFLLGKKAGAGLVKGLSNVGYNQPTPTKPPPVPGATQPMPPTHPDPMPDFTGDNVHVEPTPPTVTDDPHAPLPHPDYVFDDVEAPKADG